MWIIRRKTDFVPEDYGIYRYSGKECVRIAGKTAGMAAVVGYLFYDSIWGCLLLFPVFLAAELFGKKKLIAERRRHLTLEFRDALAGVSAALSSGYSAENAIGEALKDLRLLYPDGALIVREFVYMNARMRNGSTAEEVLSDFGERSGTEDIRSFAEVFSAAKRGGGNMIAILQRSIDKINRRIEVKCEIRTFLAAKRYETLILKMMPFGIILYLRICSPGFLEPLYHNAAGIGVMTVLLLLYLGCAAAADRLMEVEI